MAKWCPLNILQHYLAVLTNLYMSILASIFNISLSPKNRRTGYTDIIQRDM